MQLTDEQKRALDFSRNISVTAGAGAGKTRLLVERFMEIAVKKYHGRPRLARKILAITFTNKAAGEMRERIARAVEERLKNAEDPAAYQHLLGIRDQLNSVAISTIHSFCARVLREYPIEAGLPPDFSELDEMQTNMLMNRAIDQLFEQVNGEQDAEKRAAYFELFQHFDPQKVKVLLRRALLQPFEMAHIVRRFAQFDDEQAYFDFVSELWLNAIRQLWPQQALRQVMTLAGHLTDRLLPGASNNAVKKHQHMVSLKTLVAKPELELEDFRKIIAALEAFTASSGKAYGSLRQFGGKKSWAAGSEEAILQLSEHSARLLELKQNFDPGPPPQQADRQFYHLFKIILEMYRAARELFEQLKTEIPGVDFEDLLIKTLRLLQNNEQIREELVRRYEFIMVDEFQDTNALQWQIIELLATEDGALQPHKIFVVGDPKQSIYGFRNADIRIFKTVKEKLALAAGVKNAPEYPGNVVLKNSFRFLPRLNAFINDLFADLLQPQAHNMYEVEFEPLVAQRTAMEKGRLELALLREEDGLNEEEYMAQTIDRLVRQEKVTCHERQGDEEVERPLTFGDIAILLRSRNALLAVEQSLRRWNIPFKTVKGVGFWQKQEIYDFYHLLHFLAAPSNDFYLVALLRSRLFLVPDHVLFLLNQQPGENYWQKLSGELDGPFDEGHRQKLLDIRALLRRWIEVRDAIPLGELLRMVLDDLKYRTLISAQINGEQLLANIEKFIDHVLRFNKSGMNGLLELIRQVELLIEEDSKEGEPQLNLDDRETVKVMTIHAAKGLQFPVVFVPYLNAKNVDNVRQAVFMEPEIGIAMPFRSDGPYQSQDFCLLNLLKAEKQKRELAEAKRIFYVAATRSSEHLFLSARIKNDTIQRTSVLEWLNEFFSRRGVDLLDRQTELFKAADYRLHLVYGYKPQNREGEEIKGLFEGLEHLKGELQKPLEVDEKRLQLYRPLQERPGPIIFSATRLMTYVQDAQNYYQRYHLGFFESDYQLFADNIYQMDDSLVKGKIFHRFLELVTENERDDDALLDRIFFEFEVFDGEKRAELEGEILALKEKIFQSSVGLQILQAAEARNELTVMMHLGQDFFTGTLDRIIKNKQGLWQVVDYKTNRISAAQVRELARQYEWQMKGYALLLSKLYPQQEHFPVALYFVHPDQLHEIRYTPAEIEKIYAEFTSLIEEIKTKYPVRG
ncbi:UvrD-helicase domain-containing protein [Caldithrix abyssi]